MTEVFVGDSILDFVLAGPQNAMNTLSTAHKQTTFQLLINISLLCGIYGKHMKFSEASHKVKGNKQLLVSPTL